ncbi:MAG TPA: FAD-dependent oxidoreductase [Solirubrobacterales bacterium]|nr:FAD-dependent oxidoreductase [Solirubrobacterales bacterium]
MARDGVYWLSEAEAGAPTEPLDRAASADVVVVGGGYAGLWTAWAIRERAPDARVVVLEARTCGEGPSGRNAGFANSFWHHLAELGEQFGERRAVEVCRAGSESVDAIRAWASERDLEISFRAAGQVNAAASPAQDDRWLPSVRACEQAGERDRFFALTEDEVRARCGSPRLRGGAMIPDSATVHPARLAFGLRGAVADAGVRVCERTPARRLSRRGDEVVVEAANGARVTAPAAVVAINAAAAGFGPLRGRLAVTSTHMVATEPVPDVLEEVGWTGGEGVSTAGTYLHYFRTTPDGRIAFGWGGGRVAYGARLGGRVASDPSVIERVRADLVSFFPGLRGRRVTHAWGGAVDVSPTQHPVVGSLAGDRVHYVYGFTGNGVGPAHLAGRILASLALDRRDELTRLALVESAHAPVPPEPLRYLGGTLVRTALLRKESREDAGLRVDPVTRLIVDMPRRLGIHIGR